MREDELTDLFAALVRLFEGAGLAWIVNEVQLAIAQGIEEQVDPLEWTGKRKPSKGDARTTRRDYSTLERIELLVDSVSRVVRDGTDVEIAVAAFFAAEKERVDGAPTVIRFRDGRPDSVDDDGFVLEGHDELAARKSAVTALLTRLDEVKAEARP